MMALLFEPVAAAIAFLAGVAALGSLAEAIQALRAKSRLRVRVTSRLQHDAMLRALQTHALQSDLSDEDLAELHAVIENLVNDLPERDQRLVRRSLQQPSKAGERRYIKEMLTAA